MAWALVPIGLAFVGALVLMSWKLRAARRLAEQERTARQEQFRRLQALERLAERDRAILHNAMDGFFVLGEDYRFQEVNPAFCRMVGYTADELRQMKMTDLEVGALGPERGSAAHWRTGLHHLATTHRHKNGHLIQLESCVIALRDGPGKILVGFARDVTERCRAEQALRESEAKYRTLVEMSRDLIWSVDLEGRWTFVNDAARSIYGYEPEEMLGRPVLEFVRPELRARAEEILSELRAGRARLRFETEHLRKDGSVACLRMNAIPVCDERGNVVGLTGTSADITERRRAEERLRAAHARFESLVAGMPLGYIVWSVDFRVLEWNPAAATIFGYSSDQAIGRAALDLIVPPEGREAFTNMCSGLLAREVQTSSVLVNCTNSGTRIKCEWFNTVLPGEAGGVQGVVSLVRDLSERERLEAQLRQSQKLESLGVLAGGVAHDFNNLLVGILGNASLASEQLPQDAPAQRLIERIIAAGQRAKELTQRMLAYAGRATCDVKIVDLGALVDEIADFAVAAVPKNVALHLKTEPGLPLVMGDSGQIQQVIMNLLINAAEAIGEQGGDVTVALRPEELDARRIAGQFPDQHLKPGLYVCLEVRDTGCGMSPDTMARIFEPFFTTKFGGRGLGLCAVLGIVRAHHGALTVSSQVGAGTVFRVLFPAAPTSAARPAAPSRKGAALARGSTVLVIDDEEEVRQVVQEILESRGINVLSAESGERGVELFRQHAERIDVVLLDMNMPGMSGALVFKALQSTKPDVKVIVSTGYSQQEVAEHFAGAKLAGFVDKPYTCSALIDKIGAALGSSA